MQEQKFKMIYLGSPVHHSKLINVYKECCNAVNMESRIKAFDVSLSEFYQKTAAIKEEHETDICITLPHKVAAYKICDELTERARIAGSVNVIRNENGYFIGDNTDGVGFIESNKQVHNVQFKDKSVLLIGAGGCARGLIQQIHNEQPSTFHMTGRPSDKFDKVKEDFKTYFDEAYFLNNLPKMKYDVVINATSSSVNKTHLALPSRVLSKETTCLECAYNWTGNTLFTDWCHSQGVKNVYDGATMLIEQALFAMDFFKDSVINRDEVHQLLGFNKAIRA